MSSVETDIGHEPGSEDERRREQWVDRGDREPATIERELDATRADLQATLTALERRLSFDRLVDLTVGRIREHGGQFAGNLGHAATQNPVPLLLTSIGLGWMMLESRRGHSPRSAQPSSMDRMGSKMENVSGKMHEAVDASREQFARARDSLTGAADSLRSSASQYAESARHAAGSVRSTATEAAATAREHVEHARQSFDDMLEQQPLLLGAIGLAAGALVGAVLPMSETEDRVLSDARQRALRTATRAARERLDESAAHEPTRREAEREQYAGQPGGRGGDQRSGAGTQRPARPH
jgi:hypothetical protein